MIKKYAPESNVTRLFLENRTLEIIWSQYENEFKRLGGVQDRQQVQQYILATLPTLEAYLRDFEQTSCGGIGIFRVDYETKDTYDGIYFKFDYYGRIHTMYPGTDH